MLVILTTTRSHYLAICNWYQSLGRVSNLYKSASNRFLITPPCSSSQEEASEVNTVSIRLRMRPHVRPHCRRVRSTSSTLLHMPSRGSTRCHALSRATRASLSHTVIQLAPSQHPVSALLVSSQYLLSDPVSALSATVYFRNISSRNLQY